jgi:hypothetical protein
MELSPMCTALWHSQKRAKRACIRLVFVFSAWQERSTKSRELGTTKHLLWFIDNEKAKRWL